MNWQYPPYTPLQMAAFIISFGLAVYALGQRRVKGAGWFALLMVGVSEWTLFNFLERGTTNLDIRIIFLNMQYFGILLTPLAWLGFISQYTGQNKWLRSQTVLLLLLIPLLILLCVWINPGGIYRVNVYFNPDGTLHTTMGPCFWVNVVYSYGLILVSTILILIFIHRASALYRRQGILLALSALITLASNVYYIFGLSRRTGLDLTPLSFTLTGILLGLDIFFFRLFDIFPVPLDKVMDTIDDAILVLDTQTRIVNLNQAAEALMSKEPRQILGLPLDTIWPGGARLLNPHLTDREARGEIAFREGKTERYYDLHASPLIDHGVKHQGWVIVLRDITERQNTEAALRIQKRILENLVTVARATSEDLTMEETLQNILEVTVTLTGAEVGNLLLVDEEGNPNQNILSLANDRFIYDRDAAGQALREGLAGWVIRHRKVIRIPDTQKDERWIPLPGTATFTARSVLAAPIVGGSALFGVLTLTHTEPERFTEDHVTLIRLAVDQIASAVRNAHLYDEQRALTNRLATLYEVLRQVGSHLDPYFVAEAAVSAVERLAGWPTVMVLLPDETGNRLVLHAAAGSNLPPLGVSIGITEGICGRAFRRGETQYVKNVDEDPDYVSVSDHTRSELAVPLRRGDQILGILNVEGARRFNDEDRQLAASLSEAIALALDNARFYEQIQRYANAIAEERSRFEAMIRSSRDGIVLVDMNLRTVVLNQAALQHLGLAGEPQQWEKRTLHDLLVEIRYSSPEAVHAAIKEIRRMRHGDEPAGEGEISLPPRTLYWLNLPVMSGTTFVGRLLVFRDVTQERLVAQIRENLTHTLVHDLRSPLSSISTALQFLELNLIGEIDEDYAQALDIALGSTERMLRLIDTILDISGLESGEMPLDRSEFALRPLVVDVERVHLPQIRGKNLQFLNAVPETLPLLHADRDLVERVLQNLLHNAIKFTAAGGKISLTANVCETRPEYLSISISDTGCGIPPDLQPRLFEKFSTGRTLGRGKGLGLTFCRMAVEAHGGRIWVEETSEAGTTFTLTLPSTNGERPNAGNVAPRREESRSRR